MGRILDSIHTAQDQKFHILAEDVFVPGAPHTSLLSTPSATCPPGTYSLTGKEPCNLCTVGTYQGNSGQSSCVICPTGKTTFRPGSISSVNCTGKPDTVVLTIQLGFDLSEITERGQVRAQFANGLRSDLGAAGNVSSDRFRIFDVQRGIDGDGTIDVTVRFYPDGTPPLNPPLSNRPRGKLANGAAAAGHCARD
jgi:hypothetical protein